MLAAKHCIMQANAELHQSILAKQNKHFGEEIARLQVGDRPSLCAIVGDRAPDDGFHWVVSESW